jgi:hypothetical protein
VPGFLSSRPNWLPPPPHPQAIAAIPPFGFRRGDTLACGRGEPIRTKGQTLWYSRYSIIHRVYISTLWYNPSTAWFGCSIYVTSLFLCIICYVKLCYVINPCLLPSDPNIFLTACSLFNSF